VRCQAGGTGCECGRGQGQGSTLGCYVRCFLVDLRRAWVHAANAVELQECHLRPCPCSHEGGSCVLVLTGKLQVILHCRRRGKRQLMPGDVSGRPCAAASTGGLSWVSAHALLALPCACR
jgi:hypothetical protein